MTTSALPTLNQSGANHPARARLGYGLMITGLVAALVSFGMYAFFGWQLVAWQGFVMAGAMLVFAVLCIIALVLARSDRLETGLQLLHVAILPLLFAPALLFENVAGVHAMVLAMVSAVISLNAASARLTRILFTLSVAVATLAIILEFVRVPWRLAIPELQVTVPFIGVAVIIACGAILLWGYRDYGIGTKLTIAIIGITVVAIAAVTFVADRLSRAAYSDDVGSNLKGVADSQALAVNGLLSEQLSRLRAMSLSEVIRTRVAAENLDYVNLSEAEIRSLLSSADQVWIEEPSSNPLLSGVINDRATEELRKFGRMFPDHTQVFVTDKYGGQIAATERLERFDLSQEPWWQAAFNRGVGANYISQPEFDEQGKFLGLRVLVPLYTVGQQEFIGVLGSLYSLDGLSDILDLGRIGTTGRTDIYLPTGWEVELEVQPGHEHVGGASGEHALEFTEARLEPQVLQMLQAGGRYVAGQHDGVPSLSAPSAIANVATDPAIAALDWTLVTRQTQADAELPIEARTRLTLLVGLGAAALAGLLALLLSRYLTAPITRLTATAARVSGGDLTAQAPVETNDEIGALATTFNVMTTQLRESVEGLEQRVAERTRALRTTIEVSRRISTSMDRGTLATQVVEQLQSAFGYYHAHIYFFDEAKQNLVMAGGTGDAGRKLLERGHRLPKGRGLVGRAAERNEVVLVPDTLRDAQWLPNPLLPETKAEVAVPIAVGEQVFGVLDVQQNVVNGLSQEDADLLQSLANQVAIALQNAQSFERAREQASLEAQVNAIGQKIQSATSIEGALQVAARELGRALGGARTRVHLKSDEGNGNGHATAERGD